MLTRIYIDNFRCFVNFEYRPESKQLLLGPNGSGKSSLFDALNFIKRFVNGDENLFTQLTRTRWQDRPNQVLEIGALLENKKYEYRVEIRFAPDTKQLSVAQERLKVDDAIVFELVQGKIHFFTGDSGQATSVPLETTKSALYLSLLSNYHVRRFVEWTKTIHCFRIDEYPEAMEEKADSEEREPDSELENLAGWYRHLLQTYPRENVAFTSSLNEALAGFQTLRFSSDEHGRLRLWADFAGPKERNVSYALSELSDGQRYLLALYMILHFLIARGQTVFIDEPDNFVALREIQPWLLAAEAAVDDHNGQLILISHHSELLNLWARSYGLRFFREDNGHVRTEKFKADPGGNLQPSELIARGWEDE
jgi:predicted ATPase